MISPESWGVNFVSKHHYAIELAKSGANVFFLNSPGLSFAKKEILEGLFVIDYKPKYRGLSKLPNFLVSKLTEKEINILEHLTGVEFDVIWNFDSSRFFNLNSLKNKLKICHIVDMAENINRNLLARTSDICFCTSDYLKIELGKFNNKVFKIHHGYQFSEDNEAFELLKKEGVKVGVLGNLTRSCIDWKILLLLIRDYPTVDFHFMGSYTTSNLSKLNIDSSIIEILKKQSNVFLYGAVESKFIPSFLSQMDVQLCVYKMLSVEDYAQHSNLHKIMEYLGSGKVTITSWVDEFKYNLELVKMSKNHLDLPVLFKDVITNLEKENENEKVTQRRAFAFDNSYTNQLNKILTLINKNV